ncbi:methionyl-tRNA formyltransferase [Xanthomarina sp. F2636L]|uniref:methionyl-tRNA formyltransferase n=1 Tax=Xanthomarina sp. F2636L TaxID=2996018 RepID=UPI00225E427C|nr:methionyl-tRNA formyltransferase [Xanthomarina sp. F2636L]MCX7550307.1 methionyl-tRNA formyltransferase [Xanthomarina sp. F2636L]
MTNLRIVFMGTPDFAVSILKTLVENKHQVVGVITAPDKPAGRGRKLNESAVKVYAKSQGLHIMQPTNLKNEDFIAELKALNANLQIVVAFRMLPKAVWEQPKYGTFNLHASLLPDYRGAAPINWAIINGETKTGVSTFFIDEKIDTGDIILQKEIAIETTDNAGILHDKLMHAGSELVMETVKLIESDTITTQSQPQTEGSKTAYKLHRDNCKIDWADTSINIYNKIRGLSPHPSAWCYLKNGEDTLDIKVYTTKIEEEGHQLPLGELIISKTEIKVAVNEGFINILELKLPGKRKMDAKSLLNGYTFESSAKML